MKIRPARSQDAPEVVRLMRQLDAVSHGEVDPEVESRFKDMLTRADYNVCIAEDDGRVIGLITASLRHTLWHAGPIALIDELVIDEAARDQGVGRALIDTIVGWAREHNASEVEVSTEKDNELAQAFYQHCGFEYEAVLLELEFD
jgi:ribosomal protein S18 acetylase RimI-like enzyme